MADKENQLSLDDQAAQMAASMNFAGAGAPLEKGGAAGDMPTGQGSAEGGFAQDAGGQVITAGVEGAVSKSGQTGPDVTNEPTAQNQMPQTGDKTTKEPKADAGGGAGDGGNLSQNADEATRARKPGHVGVSGGSTGGGMPENQDDYLRGRKAGKVGISKAEAFDMGLTKAQYEALAEKGLVKADANNNEEEEEEEEEGAEKGKGKACKSEITENDLMKSLETLEAVAAGSAIPTTEDRRMELAKGLEAGTLTQGEMVELADLMKSATGAIEEPDADVDPEDLLLKSDPEFELDDDADVPLDDLNKSFQEQFADAEEEPGTYDASPFLERLHQQTAAALDQIQGNLQKSMDAQSNHRRNFDVQLAKSLRGMAQQAQNQETLIKSLTERLETVENQPIPRRGITTPSQAVLNKAMPNEAGSGGQEMSKDQILDTMEAMVLKGMEVAPCGERLDRAVALFESPASEISKSMYQDVINFRNGNNGVH
jgi:hypothetical protein